MVTWKTNIDTAHTVLIVSDQIEPIATWTALFSQRNCIVLVENNIDDAIQSDLHRWNSTRALCEVTR